MPHQPVTNEVDTELQTNVLWQNLLRSAQEELSQEEFITFCYKETLLSKIYNVQTQHFCIRVTPTKQNKQKKRRGRPLKG